MKTPKGIKMGLRCGTGDPFDCGKCPYRKSPECVQKVSANALEYIGLLEEAKQERDAAAEELQNVKAELEQVKRERAAVLADLKANIRYIDDGCKLCAHYVECREEDCPHYISGAGGEMTDKNGTVAELPDMRWSCMDFDFGSCDLRKDTPCATCDFVNNWEWRGVREVKENAEMVENESEAGDKA